uniref:Pentatricopeptide repeat-containing protein n=1 Tax=Ananas comosus var. bracteatus TaxID=296719 RepID=A0A6V7PKK3_ANACO|nr:unnamed protein product [Ananas comosus var. bracteatus]
MPNLFTHRSILSGLCKKGMLVEARWLEPTIVTCNSLIYAFCKVGNLTMAESFFKTFELKRLVPTVVTYTILMDAFCEAGNFDSMLKLFDEMVGMPYKAILLFDRLINAGFKVSIKDFSSAINRLCKVYYLDEAKMLFKMMICFGIRPDQKLAAVMCNALNKKNDFCSLYVLQALIVKGVYCLGY